MKCRECKNRTTIIDDDLCDVVGSKCILTEDIIEWEIEDGIKDCCDNCPLK